MQSHFFKFKKHAQSIKQALFFNTHLPRNHNLTCHEMSRIFAGIAIEQTFLSGDRGDVTSFMVVFEGKGENWTWGFLVVAWSKSPKQKK